MSDKVRRLTKESVDQRVGRPEGQRKVLFYKGYRSLPFWSTAVLVYRRSGLPLFCLILALAACRMRPTYPESQISESLRLMCSKDYQLAIESRYEGKSLQAHVWKVGLFKAGISELQGMSRESLKSLQDVLLCSTRIALSTDAKLEFIEVKLADVVTGTTLTILRYVPDIKDSMLQRIGDTEYFHRLVIDIQPGELAKPKKGTKAVSLGETRWDTPISFAEFLAKQVIMRARRDGAERFLAHADLSEPSTLGVVIENWPSIADEDPAEADKMADVIRQSAQKVVKGYRFRGFKEMVLRDAQGIALHRWAF